MYADLNADSHIESRFNGWDFAINTASFTYSLAGAGLAGYGAASLVCGDLDAAVQCVALIALGLMSLCLVTYSIGLYEALRAKKTNLYANNPPSSAPDLLTRIEWIAVRGFGTTFKLGRECISSELPPWSIESCPVEELADLKAWDLSNYTASILLSREDYLQKVNMLSLLWFKSEHPNLFEKLLADERLPNEKRRFIQGDFSEFVAFHRIVNTKLEEAKELFGFNDQMTEQELNRKYRKLTLQYHPDKFKGDSEKEEEFKRLGELRDELKKCCF